MVTEIRFGTDGWRSIIARDFTFDNVSMVAEAIGNYLSGKGCKERGVFIGYDNRFLSEDFAFQCGKVLSQKGFKVFLAGESVPTPVTAFMVRHMKLNGALMITASHNPPEYNGIKFIPDYGGPATDDITGAIEANLRELQKNNNAGTALKPDNENITLIDDFTAYKREILHILDRAILDKSRIKPIVDIMHGAAGKILPDILKNYLNFNPEVINGSRDPMFGGMLPDPSEKNLSILKNAITTDHFDLGLAVDGDADRFGIIDGRGIFISPNNIISISLRYLLQSRAYDPGDKVVRTVATTHLIDAICNKYGIEVLEMPVGFKYIGKEMISGNIIIGGEESGGMSVKGHIPEKDGVLAVLLVLEIQSYINENKDNFYLSDYLNEIYNEFGTFYNKRLDIRVNLENKSRIIDYFLNLSGKSFFGMEVKNIIDIDGAKIILEDGSWILVRPSGTEPLIRCYIESTDGNIFNDLVNHTREEIRNIS